MQVPSTSLALDRFVLAAAVVLTCVLFTPAAADPVNVIKLTALVLCALALITSAIYRVVRYRVAHVPVGPAAWAAGALALGLVVSSVVAPVTATAILGAYGRNSGLLAYLSALVIFAAALRVLQRRGSAVLIGAVVFGGLFTATYGLLQKAGIDSIRWNNPFNPIIAAMGNPNFASGYLGISAAVAVGGALWTGWALGWRVLSGITAALCLLAATLSVSVQGPIAAAAGLFVVALAAVLGLSPQRRRAGLAALSSLAVIALGLFLAGLRGVGPISAVFSDYGSRARVHYWAAAIEMFRDRPVLGVGLDQYGNFWRSSRTPESVSFLGGPQYSDAAHSVPLQVLAQGGVLLGLAYFAFLGVTLYALLRGLLRLTGPDRALLGAVGGGWVAYQLQSFVSIDQVPLIVVHFALAGAVVAASGVARTREVRLPGAPQPLRVHPNDAKARRRAAAATTAPARAVSGADVAVLGAVGVGVLAAAWFALVPLRANVAASNGDELLAAGDGTGALVAYQRATELAPSQPVYWGRQGNLLNQVQQPAMAQKAYTEAVERDPFEIGALRAAADLSEKAGDLDAARSMYRRLIEVDPLNTDSLVGAATFELRHGGAATARATLEKAVKRLPGQAALWATLGDARAVTDDADGARQAYETALMLEPGQPTATEGLKKLA